MNDISTSRTDRVLPSSVVIDDGIRLLVSTLNRSGLVTTIGSCAGHAWGGRAPYVYFKCQVPVAAAIERTLRDLWVSGCGLNVYWEIRGLFNEVSDLCFVLSAARLDDLATDPWRGWLALGIGRKRVDYDLCLLSSLLHKLLAQFRNVDFSHISRAPENEYEPDEPERNIQSELSPRRVFFAAFRAVRCVLSNLISASGARDSKRH